MFPKALRCSFNGEKKNKKKTHYQMFKKTLLNINAVHYHTLKKQSLPNLKKTKTLLNTNDVHH